MSRSSRFTGFSRQMPQFFRALEKNNQRDWFGPRKELYESQVRGPMIGLVTLLNEKLRSFAADHVAEEPARNVYRIYRDTRFSRDKTPYKSHIAATFAHRTLPRHGGAGFYLEVSHRYVGIAGGVYMPGPEELEAIRAGIAADAKGFRAVAEDRKVKRLFGVVQGERLKRLPKRWLDHADAPVAEFLKLKQFYWWAELPASLALSPRLAGTVVRYFEAMSPGIGWFNRVLLADRAKREVQARPVRPEPMW